MLFLKMRKKHLLVLTVCLCFCFGAVSQTINCDSIIAIEKINTFDSTQLKAYSLLVQQKVQENCNVAICLSKEGIERSREVGNINLELQYIGLLGYAYKSKGDFNLSVNEFIRSLRLAERKGLVVQAAIIANNIGTSFLEAGKYKEAQMYFLQAMASGKRRQDKSRLAHAYANYGYLKDELKQFDSALYFYNLALPEIERAKDSVRLADLFLNIGRSIAELNQLHEAINNYKKALSIYEILGDKDGVCRTRLNLAEVYIKKNDPAQAIIENELALKVARDIQSDYLLDFCYEALADNYSAIGNYKKALENFRYHKALNDSLNSLEKNEQLIRLQEQYQGEKKDREIFTKTMQIRNQEAEKRNLRNWLLASTIVIGVIVFLIITLRRQNQRLNVLLKEKEFLISEVHHRVKNNLQLLSGLFGLHIASLDDEKSIQVLQDSQSRVQTIANVHAKLYKQENVEYIDLDMYLKTLIEDICKSYPNNQLKLNHTSEAVKLHVDKTIVLGLIINEILTNSFKHAFKTTAFPEITVVLSMLQNKITLIVSDNGSGISPDVMMSEKSSLGFRLIKSLCKQLKAQLQRESKNGVSYRIEFYP